MSPTLSEQLGVVELQPGEFESKLVPFAMGNTPWQAYGGCAVGLAVSAASAGVPETFAMHSLLGHFYGPGSTKEKMYCTVRKARDTRSFITRHVQVKQRHRDGSLRTCLEAFVDFHVRESTWLEYWEKPSLNWPKPEDCPYTIEHAKDLAAKGAVTPAQAEDFIRGFQAHENYFESKYCPGALCADNLHGTAKNVVTSQDHLDMADKISGEWFRCPTPLASAAENAAAMAFMMDGQLAFTPLTHHHLWFEDTSACSTLDFALRVYTPDFNMEEWHCKEMRTTRGGSGRTYAEGKLWNEKGELIAGVTQNSILRPSKARAANL